MSSSVIAWRIADLTQLMNMLRALGIEVSVSKNVLERPAPFLHNAFLRFLLENLPVLSMLGLRSVELRALESKAEFARNIALSILRKVVPLTAELPVYAAIHIRGEGMRKILPIIQSAQVDKYIPYEKVYEVQLVLEPESRTVDAVVLPYMRTSTILSPSDLGAERLNKIIELLPEEAKLLLSLLPQLGKIARYYVELQKVHG